MKSCTRETSAFSDFLQWEITRFILLYEKFLQFDWLTAVVVQLNLKYLHVKITVSTVTKITKQIQKQWRKDFQIFKLKRFKN